MPKLILKFESAIIKEYPITASVMTVGRKSDNDVVIDHPAVSGHHCKIILQGDTYFVEDLNSTNGTLVNGKKIIKAGIHDEDVIAVAKHTLSIVGVPAGTTPAPAAAMPTDPAPAASATLDGLPAEPPKRSFEKVGGLRIVEGAVDQSEYTLAENSTYIGKADRVEVKIKGLMAPEVAAMICRKGEGYVLVAIKEGYPKVNGMAIEKEKPLNEGDTLEIGSTKMQFYIKSA